MKIHEILQETRLKTAKGSPIKRSSKFGVGKEIGGAVYIHKEYAHVLPDDLRQYESAVHQQYPDFEYTIIKYDLRGQGVSFLLSPDFDTANEPLITEYVTVKPDGSTKKGKSKTIYHHKWLFVKDDYKGFNVEESIQRSRDWLAIPDINFSRIGSSRDYWLSFLKANQEHLPDNFVYESQYYTGQPLETGGTSTNFNAPAPAIKDLIKKSIIKPNHTVLDYGAGKYGRNANFLRNQNIKTYAYDPFNGYSDDGWNEVAKSLPKQQFDVGFSSFVLNVVPKHIEDNIVADLESRAKTVVHIVRNSDVFNSVKKALLKKDKTVWSFFEKEFVPVCDCYENDEITDELVRKFTQFGVQTSRGFQRIPNLEDSGYTLAKGSLSSPYKVYIK